MSSRDIRDHFRDEERVKLRTDRILDLRITQYFLPVTREKAQRESGRRKRQDEDYNELFLRRNEIKTRQCVYISRDVHGKILRIVNDIAGGEISVGGYVDTVLRQHLEQHKERINELYKKQREDLI